MRRWIEAFVMIVCVALAFLAGVAYGAEPDVAPKDVGTEGAGPSSRMDSLSVPTFLAQTAPAVLALRMQQTAWWQTVAWNTALEVERVKIAEAGVAGQGDGTALGPEREGTDLPVVRQVVPSPQPSSSVGECGGATNGADRYIARESGGDPNVYNTGGSGAWGCYQIMPGTWASSCSDLGQHGSASADVQAQCASRLPLSAWGG